MEQRKRNEDSLKELRDNIKCTNILIIGIPERGEKGPKKIFEEIIVDGDPTSLPPHERLTDVAVVPREKPHTGAAAREDRKSVAPPSSQDEALSRYSASGEVPR